MPKVGNKHFPYTPKGFQQAKEYALKTKMPIKHKPIKRNPNMVAKSNMPVIGLIQNVKGINPDDPNMKVPKVKEASPKVIATKTKTGRGKKNSMKTPENSEQALAKRLGKMFQ